MLGRIVALPGLRILIAACAALACCPASSTAADDDPRPVNLKADGDGFPIVATYYPARKDKNPAGLEKAAVVVLLHGEDGSRLIWDKSSAPPGPKAMPFAPLLHDNGYAVVTVDLRKHGDSLDKGEKAPIEPLDYGKMVAGDLVAVKRFLVEEHEAKRLNVNKLAIIAADNSSAVAAEFARGDWAQPRHLDGPGGSPGTPRGQDVRALVFLSPVLTAGRAQTRQAMNFLKGPAFQVAFLFIAGSKDPQDKGAAKALHDVVKNVTQNAERTYLETPNTNARGTDLLGNPAARIEPKVLAFLDLHLKKLDSEWRTRKSRYERDAQ